MQKRLNEIIERKREIKTEIETADEARIAQLDAEVDALMAEERQLQERMALTGKLAEPEQKPAERGAQGEIEQRGRDLKEKRAVTIGSGELIRPTKNQSTINDGVGTGISSVVDLVKVTPCYGMSEYQVPYKTSDMQAAKNTENKAATNSDPTFAYAVIKPVTLTTYSEISREAMKLTDIDYYGAVRTSAMKALRKKVAEYIMLSDAASNALFIGIKDATAITSGSDVALGAVDATTLRKVTMSYGGDEDIVGGGVLFLNKKDLIAFGDVRGTSEKKAIYEITPDTANPNTGILKDGGLSVRYCLNSNLKAIADAAAGEYIMFYGAPTCYEVGLFSDYSVRVSEDFKFSSRMLAVLGEVMIGGNVTVKDGFVRVKKPTA